MDDETLYMIHYEQRIEPLYSRATRVQPGKDGWDARKKFLEKEGEDKVRVLDVQEFTVPGYKINLERIVESPHSE